MPFSSSREVIHAWVDTANGRRPGTVYSLYSDQSALLPTFSPYTLRTEEGRKGYFDLLASRPGMEVFLHEKTLRFQQVAVGVEIVSGIYRFQFAIDEEPLVFEARFTFVIDLSKERPILHHHSSQIPRTLS
jgi:hypothetical protein